MSDDTMLEAARALRALIAAGDHHRQAMANSTGLGLTETQALSFLAMHEGCGQSELAYGLRLTSSAATALVDRLERQGVAERMRHLRDRRRFIVRLTSRGNQLVAESQECLQQSLGSLAPADLTIMVTGMRLVASHLTSNTGLLRLGGKVGTRTSSND